MKIHRVKEAGATWKLYPELLEAAYAQGYFPFPDNESDDIVWLNPDPRAILPLDRMHVSRSLAKTLRQGKFTVTFDKAFQRVMQGCADRPEGTWILPEFFVAYTGLFKRGTAHSVEVWQGTELVGGTYGVCLGGAFFAESKFYTATDASKVALYHLVERLRKNGFALLEVQFLTDHLERLGAIELPGAVYHSLLQEALKIHPTF